jgi:hypothetical protein
MSNYIYYIYIYIYIYIFVCMHLHVYLVVGNVADYIYIYIYVYVYGSRICFDITVSHVSSHAEDMWLYFRVSLQTSVFFVGGCVYLVCHYMLM